MSCAVHYNWTDSNNSMHDYVNELAEVFVFTSQSGSSVRAWPINIAQRCQFVVCIVNSCMRLIRL